MTEACVPYTSLQPFRLSRIEQLPGGRGIYGFWYRRRCIYIGKAQDQPIRTRLEQHWKRCHNDDLRLWMEATRGDLLFAICVVEGPENIDAAERRYIRRFQPVANKTLK